MGNAPPSFILSQVPSTAGADAFAFHQSIASHNEHIWPRSEEEILKFSEDGELFGVRRQDTGEFVGLCYAHLDEESGEWEIGGLTIDEGARRLGLATVLARFALTHTIANQSPWKYRQEIIAHVHKENDKPRRLLDELGFEQIGTVELPGNKAPASMKRNSAGNVEGDKFQFPRGRVRDLSAWFDQFNGTLPRNGAQIVFEGLLGGLNGLRQALQEAVSALEK